MPLLGLASKTILGIILSPPSLYPSPSSHKQRRIMRPREWQGLDPRMTAWNRASTMPYSVTNSLNCDDSEKYTLLCGAPEIFYLFGTVLS